MKSKIVLAACALLLFSAMAVFGGASISQSRTVEQSLAVAGHDPAAPPSLPTEAAPQHCTVFYASDDQVALGGNNEDCFNPRTKIWFLPPEDGKYGLAVVGYEDYVWQGAVNDHGLFYDGLSVRDVRIPEEPGKPVYAGSLTFKVMTECATVDCVLQTLDRYNRGPATWNGQVLFGDSTGNSVIVEPLTTVRKEGRYQVATNFFQSEVSPERRTDTRYRIATEMFKGQDHFSVDLFRDILNGTHQAGDVQTLYSTIYDLKGGLIYLYYFHDFDHVVTLNLKEELAKGIHSYDIPSLFPASPAAVAFGKSIANYVSLRQEALGQVKVRPELLATYGGKYEFAPEENLFVKSEGERIFARDYSLPWVELTPVSDTHFAQVAADGMGKVREIGITFQTEAGQVTGLEYDDGMGNQMTARKVAQPAAAPTAAQPASTPGLWLLAALLVLLALFVGVIVARKRSTRPG